MKFFFACLILILIFVSGCQSKKKLNVIDTPVQDTVKNNISIIKKKEVTRILIIYYDKKFGKEQLLKAVVKFDARVIYQYNALGGIAVQIPDNKTMQQALAYFKNIEGVLSVHRDEILHLVPPPVHAK